MGTFFVVVAGLVGASIGSFLNVVIWRLPRKENLSHPGSHCPRCNRPIRWFDNLPVVSWLLLRARCRACQAPIAWRYPFVELLTATLFVLAALRFENPLDATAIALLLAALVAITFIDIDHRIIPDAITKPGMVLALVLAVVTTLHPGDWIYGLKPGLNKLLHASAGILAGMAIVWGVRLLGALLFRKEAMGLGDAKLLGLIGGFTGPLGTLYTLIVACLGGTVVHGLVVLITRRRPKPMQLEVRGAGGAKGTAERVWARVVAPPKGSADGVGQVRLEFGGGGEALAGGADRGRPALPNHRVLWAGAGVGAGPGRVHPGGGGRVAVTLGGLSPEAFEHFGYFAASHRYLPFGPYLAIGGAATALYAEELRYLLMEAWPAFVRSLVGGG
jgi:leader peptidase (prepilin peptidase)/N-methyltransferase